MNQSGRYLLDTNIAIALFAGDPIVQEKVRDSDYVAVLIPSIETPWHFITKLMFERAGIQQ